MPIKLICYIIPYLVMLYHFTNITLLQNEGQYQRCDIKYKKDGYDADIKQINTKQRTIKTHKKDRPATSALILKCVCVSLMI